MPIMGETPEHRTARLGPDIMGDEVRFTYDVKLDTTSQSIACAHCEKAVIYFRPKDAYQCDATDVIIALTEHMRAHFEQST